MTSSAPDGPALTPATVLIDVQSLVWAIAGARRALARPPVRGRPQPCLANVIAVLAAHGFRTVRLGLAVATTPVWTGPESRPAVACRIAATDAAWLEREQREATVPVVPLPGAHNGGHEVGVDAVLVAGALVAARDIERGTGPWGEVVVVITHDSDLDHLAAYASPTPLVIAGRLPDHRLRTLRRRQVAHLALGAEAVADMGPDGTPRTRYDTVSVFQPDHPVSARRADPPTATTVVLDAYGIMCSAAASLGIASLPTAASTRRVLAALDWPADTTIVASVPDLPPHAARELSPAERVLWRGRDRDLDDLAHAFDHDDDPATIVVRGELHPERSEPSASLDREQPVRLAKRLATLCAAEFVSALLEPRCERAALISDLPDLAWLTIALRQTGLAGPRAVARIGAHAAPVTTVVGTDPLRTAVHPAAPFVVLPDAMLAGLVLAGPLTSRVRRGAIVRWLPDPRTVWLVTGYEPELDGYRVRAVGSGGVEAVLADAVSLGLAVGDRIDPAELPAPLTLELRFDGRVPGVAPVLAVSDGRPRGHGVPVVVLGFADAQGRSAEGLDYDLDGDGVPDGRVIVGHDFGAFEAGGRVLVGQLADGQGTSVLIGAAAAADAPLEWVEIEATGADGVRCRTAGPGEPRRGRLLPPPDAPAFVVRAGQRVRAVACGPAGAGGGGTWIALSSPEVDLRHPAPAPSAPRSVLRTGSAGPRPS